MCATTNLMHLTSYLSMIAGMAGNTENPIKMISAYSIPDRLQSERRLMAQQVLRPMHACSTCTRLSPVRDSQVSTIVTTTHIALHYLQSKVVEHCPAQQRDAHKSNGPANQSVSVHLRWIMLVEAYCTMRRASESQSFFSSSASRHSNTFS